MDIRNRTYDEVVELVNKNGRCAIVRPTGFGKSYLMCHYARGKRTLIIVPTKALQLTLLKEYPWIEETCILTTYAFCSSLLRRKKSFKAEFGDLELICLDEMHKAGAPSWFKSMVKLFSEYSNVPAIGATATPIRTDGVDVVKLLFKNSEVSEYTLMDAFRDGELPEPTYICASYSDNISDKVVNLSDLDSDSISKISKVREDILKFKQINNIPNIIRRHLNPSKKLNLVVFFSSIKALEDSKDLVKSWFTEAFPDKNVSTYSIHSKCGKFEVNFKKFLDDDSSDIKLIYTVNMLGEGVHAGALNGVVMLRRTNSAIVYTQQLGRCLSKSVESPVVFDFVNNIFTNGKPDRRNNFLLARGSSARGVTVNIKKEYNFLDVHDYVAPLQDCLERIDKIKNEIATSSRNPNTQYRIVELYRQDVSISNIAKELNISYDSVVGVLHKVGLTPRDYNSYYSKERNTLSLLMEDKIKLNNAKVMSTMHSISDKIEVFRDSNIPLHIALNRLTSNWSEDMILEVPVDKSHYFPFEFNGKLYKSMCQLADEYFIDYVMFSERLAKGCELIDIVSLDTNDTGLLFEGVYYEDLKAFAKRNYLSYNRLMYYINRGHKISDIMYNKLPLDEKLRNNKTVAETITTKSAKKQSASVKAINDSEISVNTYFPLLNTAQGVGISGDIFGQNEIDTGIRLSIEGKVYTTILDACNSDYAVRNKLTFSEVHERLESGLTLEEAFKLV